MVSMVVRVCLATTLPGGEGRLCEGHEHRDGGEQEGGPLSFNMFKMAATSLSIEIFWFSTPSPGFSQIFLLLNLTGLIYIQVYISQC